MRGSVVDNRYDVVRGLGSGGMGEVYLARDRTLGRDVALKILRSQYANDRDSAERFRREARSAASLSHPNIVAVYDRGDAEDGSSYITMEYVPGDTLKERIVQEGPLDARRAASYGYQVAEALGAAHAKGVVHRDIKPQNVLITASGQAKVADFGIARAASAVSASGTETGAVLGTAGYMSPEQALGRPATPKSDLYSLGVVLYEAVTGGLPFAAENPVAVSMKHVDEAPTPPRDLNPAVPAGMDAVVMRLLSKDPDDRYPDAEALSEDLRRVRRGLDPTLTPASDTATTAAGGPGEAETVQTPTRPPVRRVRQTSAAPARRKRSRAPFLIAGMFLLLGLLGLGWALVPGLFGSGGGSGGGAARVPSVEGLPRDRAVGRLQDAGFRTQVRTRESGEGSGGDVTGQSPPGGRRAPGGSTVTLTVGSGAATATVPSVVGLGFADAEAGLRAAGLTVGSTYDVPGGTARGVVLEQGVEPGASVPEGTEVNLGLSTGPAPTTSTASPDASASPQPETQPEAAPATAPPSDGGASDPSAAPAAGGASDASSSATASPPADPGSSAGPGGGGLEVPAVDEEGEGIEEGED